MALAIERIDEPIDLLALGARSGMYWRSDRLEAAGIGQAQRVRVSDAIDALATAGTKGSARAIGFTAMSFTPTAEDVVLIPETSLQRLRTGEIVAVSLESRTKWRSHLEQARNGASEDRPQELSVRSPVEPSAWIAAVVQARDKIRSGDLNKVVLSRQLTLTADRPFVIEPIVRRLAHRFASAMIFAIDGFVGASPELLVSRQGSTVQARPLAGTAPRGASPSEDREIADALMASTKDRSEHRITIDWFLTELLPYCSYVDAEPSPSLITVANLHHLQTIVEGVLSQPPATILELVDVTHPTPALGGDPAPDALALIAELEPYDRGRYGGPVGWLDGTGDGEFAVGIRSAQFDGATASASAGVGIVEASDPDRELAETRTKFEAILDAIMRL